MENRLGPCLAVCLFLMLAQWGRAEPPRVAPVQNRIWSGLVFATNEARPVSLPKRFAGFEQKLRSAFGYNQYRLLSEHREKMDEQYEGWLLPGKGFCVSVRSQQEQDGDYVLTLQIYQEKRLLVETRARLAKGSPMFVRGPMYDCGQLILVLVVE